MTSLLSSTLPGLGRPSSAGGFSSRLGCHVLNRTGGNAVPSWAARQQIRFASGDSDNYDDDHYKTLGVKPSDSIEKIKRVGSALRIATHSDHNKGIDNNIFIKVNAAFRILGNSEKKAKYDPIWLERYGAAQANTAARQEASDTLRRAAVAKDAARRQEEAKRAKEAADAAEAKKRDENRKARKRARREAQSAEAERQKKAADENREENERRAAVEAAKAAEEKKRKQEKLARKRAEAATAAAASQAAAEARAAELERQRKKEARRVVLRHVPTQARPWDVNCALMPLHPGRILDFGVGEGTAWVEFWTAEEAQAFHRVVTETDQFVILDKTIKAASIYLGRAKVPEGPGLISRCLLITARTEFLEGKARMFPVVIEKLAMKGFTTRPITGEEEELPKGRYIVAGYASVAVAQSAKEALGKHFPELAVSYTRDDCEKVVSRAQDDAEAGSESNEKDSNSWWKLGPVELIIIALFLVVDIYMDKNKDKSSAKDVQQKREDQ